MFDLVNGPSGETGPRASVKDSRGVFDRVGDVIAPILWTLGLELVDVVTVGQGPRSVVRVFIDKPGGVTLDDCERAHVALGPALDVADPFPHAYTLEVSSPGLDRPFKRNQDYQRAIGKRVSVKLKEPHDGQWRLVGTLTEATEDVVTITLDDRKPLRTVQLERGKISEAKRAVQW